MSCPPAVQFSYSAWVARYPEFASVSEQSATAYWMEGQLYCPNRLGPVGSVAVLTTLLNMLTAHIAALNSPTTSAGASPLTPPGRVSAAGEGSVNAQFTMDVAPGSAQWFNSTKYGAAYWQAILNYRSFTYMPGRSFGPASYARVPWGGR